MILPLDASRQALLMNRTMKQLSTAASEAATARYLEATAHISTCGQFRYRLTRRWAAGPRIAFIGLNPSIANAEILDPTVTRCVRRARAMGFMENSRG